MALKARRRKLIIFDIDGTLVDANAVDNDCFDRAFQEATGMALSEEVWSSFEEITARAIVHQALVGRNDDVDAIEAKVREVFVSNLQASYQNDPRSIRSFDGASHLISLLTQQTDYQIAIATGCWRESALFKLGCAGFDVSGIPFACASDCYGRAEIIALAAQRAGVAMEQAVYVGDGLWDLKATRQLGIPFIGTGARLASLQSAGARHFLARWELSEFAALLERMN